MVTIDSYVEEEIVRKWRAFVDKAPTENIRNAFHRYQLIHEDHLHYGPLVRHAARTICTICAKELVRRTAGQSSPLPSYPKPRQLDNA